MDKILIVDDSPTNIKILGELLKKHYQVLVADNGRKALQIAGEKKPNLILMDVMMPEMNGFEACHVLKSQPETADIPVIYITALNEKEDVIKGFEAGGQDYITKPFNPQELYLRIRTHLELISVRKSLELYATELEMKNQQLQIALDKVNKLSKVDYLTGLINRRYMLELAQKEIARCRRSGNSFSLVIADIDNFKKINDTYGHNWGDQVLIHFAAILNNNLRTNDVVARWGGEEFLFLFPETDLSGARAACEKIRAMIARSPVVYEGRQMLITATFGISSYSSGSSIDQVIKMADEALYQGKNNGKNCVIVAAERI